MAEATHVKACKPNWKLEHRVFCVEFYFKHGSFKKVNELFHVKFETASSPCKSVIQAWIDHFRTYGTVLNLNVKDDKRPTHSGRPRKRTAELIDDIREAVGNSPKRSIRKRSQTLGITPTTLWRVLKHDLRVFPYRIRTSQKLTNADIAKRLTMAVKLVAKVECCDTFLGLLFTSDEAHFDLDGKVNSKNNVFSGTQKPSEISQKPLHSERCTVWAALSARGIIGPIFIEENGRNVTVTKERYVKVLEEFWKEVESLYPSLLPRLWFQQDGAPAHTSIMAREWLKNHFGTRVISRLTPFEWAPHSPDLSPPDFYLWGYLKDKVYANKPQNIVELKDSIKDEIGKIPRSVCKDVMNNFVVRLRKCMELNGEHLEHML